MDVVASGEAIPFATAHFNLVICTQVLEYVLRPEVMISEIHRVLKPGGWLLLSVPAITLRDADEECYRIFPFALLKFLAPFAEAEVAPEGGSIIGFFRMINSGFDVLVRYPALRAGFRWTLCPAINLSGEMLHWLARSDNVQIASNYAARARK